MKAEELRIGSLLKQGESILKVIEIWEDGFSTEHISGGNFENEKIEPIPLTEEWLVKFGFTPDDHKIVYDHPAPKEPEKEHKDLGTNFPSFFYNKRLERWMDCHTRVCVDFVHQLQNLYVALTGEELTIK